MPEPWDPYPFPSSADTDTHETYYGVGLVITCWESVEFELARLFSALVGDRDGHSIRLYGDPRNFRDRLGYVSRTAAAHFIRFPDQSMEGEFNDIRTVCEGFARRRNEVAHGIVTNVANIEFFHARIPSLNRNQLQCLVVPPLHTLRHHDDDGMPGYAYNRQQLEDLALKLHEVEKAIRHYRVQIAG